MQSFTRISHRPDPNMMEFKYFTRLPPEICNEVYKLLFVSRFSVVISSPLNRRKRRSPQLDFTRVLLVSKQIKAEVKTIFYSLNTFFVGNRDWASTEQANLHALKAFTSRVPKACLSIISTVTVEMRFCRQLPRSWILGPTGYTMDPPIYEVDDKDVAQLRSVARSLLKDFVGVEHIEISTGISPGSDLKGDSNRAVKVVGMMLALPNLKQMCFRGYLDPFVERVVKSNEAKKDIISIVPFQSQ